MTLETLTQTLPYGPAPESDAIAQQWLESHERNFGLFIAGQWQFPSDSARLAAHSPSSGELLAHCVDADAAAVREAVAAAQAAFPAWAALPTQQRARHLYAIARALQKHARLLAILEALDNGKPIRETRDLDLPLAIRHFYHHAGWAQLLPHTLAEYEPLGVVGQIIPWNFPLLMLAWKIAPALAAGNTVVIKPAPQTCLSALCFAEILAEAGLPPGVVNIITGGDECGAALVASEGLAKLAFTGSSEVGRLIRRETAGRGLRLTLELGGKSPFLVFDDADQEAAIEGLVDAIWFNQGEVCCAGSRLLVQESIAEAFLERLRARMANLRLGDSLDKGIDIGAVIDPSQRDRIASLVEEGVAQGATLFQPDTPLPENGCYYPPTLLTDVAPSARVCQEEIFGPVLVAMSFRTPAEAIELANNTRYGLAASLWSENLPLALDVARQLLAGSVWVNCTNRFDAASGFGGYRKSGFGREGGREGLLEYLRPKWLPPAASDSAADPDESPPLSFPTPLGTPQAPRTIDRTHKLYIAGSQRRPDGNYSYPIHDADGQLAGMAGAGNRKDIRDAVSAARAHRDWSRYSPHLRAQILFYLAENLNLRAAEFSERLARLLGDPAAAEREVTLSQERLFTFAAHADKFGGQLQETTLRGVVAAQHEAIGVVGIVCPESHPLLAFFTLLGAALCRGNTTVIVPSQRHPLPALDSYQLLDTSDLPPGAVNLVSGPRAELRDVLADHDDVDALWYFGSATGCTAVERRSASNLKRTWALREEDWPWLDETANASEWLLRQATQVKNTWLPAGA
ncbi:MAG: aldehyde dehydrogenase family protein [Chloroflexi bacterium]|nr:aldehyde dehydrogenase family protein [Chloroflexota bacterium]